jgi:hypothetical protein
MVLVALVIVFQCVATDVYVFNLPTRIPTNGTTLEASELTTTIVALNSHMEVNDGSA